MPVCCRPRETWSARGPFSPDVMGCRPHPTLTHTYCVISQSSPACSAATMFMACPTNRFSSVSTIWPIWPFFLFRLQTEKSDQTKDAVGGDHCFSAQVHIQIKTSQRSGFHRVGSTRYFPQIPATVTMYLFFTNACAGKSGDFRNHFSFGFVSLI